MRFGRKARTWPEKIMQLEFARIYFTGIYETTKVHPNAAGFGSDRRDVRNPVPPRGVARED